MSRENVEVVRRVYEAADRRDSATVLALYDPEVELDVSRTFGDVMGRDLYRGHDGLRELFRDWHEAWENIEYDYEELIDAGDRVVALVTRRARGRASGADVELKLALVWTLRDGKAVQVVWYPTREEALEAVGLRE